MHYPAIATMVGIGIIAEAISCRRTGSDGHRVSLIAAGISIVIVAVVQGIGFLNTAFTSVAAALK